MDLMDIDKVLDDLELHEGDDDGDNNRAAASVTPAKVIGESSSTSSSSDGEDADVVAKKLFGPAVKPGNNTAAADDDDDVDVDDLNGNVDGRCRRCPEPHLSAGDGDAAGSKTSAAATVSASNVSGVFASLIAYVNCGVDGRPLQMEQQISALPSGGPSDEAAAAGDDDVRDTGVGVDESAQLKPLAIDVQLIIPDAISTVPAAATEPPAATTVSQLLPSPATSVASSTCSIPSSVTSSMSLSSTATSTDGPAAAVSNPPAKQLVPANGDELIDVEVRKVVEAVSEAVGDCDIIAVRPPIAEPAAGTAIVASAVNVAAPVVGFGFGSLDDVSESELENYLQELEQNELPNANGLPLLVTGPDPKPKSAPPAHQSHAADHRNNETSECESSGTITDSDLDDENGTCYAALRNDSQTDERAAAAIDTTLDMVLVENDDDRQGEAGEKDAGAAALQLSNVDDSFSLASTVEFGEAAGAAEDRCAGGGGTLLDSAAATTTTSSSKEVLSAVTAVEIVDAVIATVEADIGGRTVDEKTIAADMQRPGTLRLPSDGDEMTVTLRRDIEQTLPSQTGTPFSTIGAIGGLIVESLGTDCTPCVQAPVPPSSSTNATEPKQPQQPPVPAVEDAVHQLQPADAAPAETGPQDTIISVELPIANAAPAAAAATIVVAATDAASSAPLTPPRNSPIATQPLLGTVQPYWIPDSDTQHCMLCASRFSLLRRRHHCRACGMVLCAACCALRARLAYMGDAEARVCAPCADTLADEAAEMQAAGASRRDGNVSEADDALLAVSVAAGSPLRQRGPNPNNPMEYCSQVSPMAAAAAAVGVTQPIAVMVPVSVLKRPQPRQATAAGGDGGGADTGTWDAAGASGGADASTSSPVRPPQSTTSPRRAAKSVMFSDGIRPGCDLADLDTNWNAAGRSTSRFTNAKLSSPSKAATPTATTASTSAPLSASAPSLPKRSLNSSFASELQPLDPVTRSYIPRAGLALPPVCVEPSTAAANLTPASTAASVPKSGSASSAASHSAITVPVLAQRYTEVRNDAALIARLQKETLRFMVQRNLFVLVRIVTLSCCVNKTIINYTTRGMHGVGTDEIIVLLETDPAAEPHLPKDVLHHFNAVYLAAVDGRSDANIDAELGFSCAGMDAADAAADSDANAAAAAAVPFLGHREHGGFLYVRPTFQCLQSITVPPSPFYIAVLVHRWEVPWARIFPLRLMLRLGALYRYYPCPHVSVRGRDSVYAEIAQTIINFLADFRTYTYTLAAVRGLRIHMEDRTMQVLVPRNRYDQVQKALANSSDHILALAGNFSPVADGHLVCIQNMEAGVTESHAYSTQAVNIQGRQRRITGASFLVLNGALKSSSGLSAKCSIVEDGLMVQIMPAKMLAVQKALREMRDVEIVCGPLDGGAEQTEVVNIRWVDDDKYFNVGVLSPIDGRPMSGVPSIRVHRGKDFTATNHIIRWTEVFILQSDDETIHNKDPVDMSKLSEQIASAAAKALGEYLDLLSASGQRRIGLRVTLHSDDVSYEAGSQSKRLGPLYMNALDNELVHTMHRVATDLQPEHPIIMELVFHILDE